MAQSRDEVIDTMKEVLASELGVDADKVTGPVLWQHGEVDQLVPPAGSRRGMALLRNADVTELTYPGARHEIFNETNKDEVLADTAGFLDRLRT
jgi:alpha-beta hydrolase superfamily lysophospholipase